MQHARIYRTWLPPKIFPKYGNALGPVYMKVGDPR